ncbi:MAG: gamma-glutamyl-gamma-aminobutyrate hydrolase family protein [Pseudomonadota bacterium]
MTDRPLPLVAVTSDKIDYRIYSWHATPEQYVDAVRLHSNVQPVIVPALGAAADHESLLERVDGLLVTGARSNVHPEEYGHDASEAAEPYDLDRDATTLPLIRIAIQKGIPLLAICRGIQELNVALGGSLHLEVQNLDRRLDHRGAESPFNDERFKLAHSIAVREGSRLAGVLGESDVTVNSVHRQAIDQLAPGLEVDAVAQDGTIEAVSVSGAAGFAVGVQWHPEYWADSDTPSRLLFEAFGEAVRQFRDSRDQIPQAAE